MAETDQKSDKNPPEVPGTAPADTTATPDKPKGGDITPMGGSPGEPPPKEH